MAITRTQTPENHTKPQRNSMARQNDGTTVELPSNKAATIPSLWHTNQSFTATLALILAMIIGGFVRIIHVIGLDFPLNDGGLFFALIQDLQHAHYALPAYTTYNLTHIPYAYPPLPFYLAALLSDIFGWAVLDIIRVLPALISTLTISVFFLLCKKILPALPQRIFATFAFALLPTSFDWLIVGGGLTRSFGYLFAILTLDQVHALYATNKKRPIISTTLFASLTILCHPGTAWFTLYSAGILLLFNRQRNKGWFEKSLWVLAGILVLTAPWWGTVVLRHGLSVFRYPYQTESFSLASLLTPFTFLFTNEPLLGILAFSGLLGLLICLRERAFFLPTWLASVFVFEPRLGATYSVLPMALLVGIGIHKVILPAITPSNRSPKPRKFQGVIPKIALGYLLLYALVDAYLAPNYQVVTADQIAAMQWIESHTPESSQFLVVTGTKEYGIDPISEWFPALSGRASLTTPQGHEWLPDREFNRRVQLHAELQSCATQDEPCIESWAEQEKISFTYIYIADGDWGDLPRIGNQLQASLTASPDYETIYLGPGGVVFAQREAAP